MHVVFDESNDLLFKDASKNVGIDKVMENLEIFQENQEIQGESCKKGIQLEVVLPQMKTQRQDDESSNFSKEWRLVHNHPISLIIGDPLKGVTTRNSVRNICGNLAFISQIEPKNFYEAKID